MIEYRAYHKTRPGKRGSAGRAVRKKEKAPGRGTEAVAGADCA